ncbi:hypothetical protein EVAR_98901_1 [Eumeta japonica]|uniref:Uncharacterized protein n=1 Tax=Eumeta variegata TaxID=151549 RepID=A0A4C1Y3E7_EUMVA|nr:hypothetical protein EVAR_98901_1 [Eumeta japonica]
MPSGGYRGDQSSEDSGGRESESRCDRGPRRLGPGWQTPPRLYDQSDTASTNVTGKKNNNSYRINDVIRLNGNTLDSQPGNSARDRNRSHDEMNTFDYSTTPLAKNVEEIIPQGCPHSERR